MDVEDQPFHPPIGFYRGGLGRFGKMGGINLLQESYDRAWFDDVTDSGPGD